MERVFVFVIWTVAINTLICFKTVPQVLQVFSCVSNFFSKDHKVPLVNSSQ